MSAYGDAMQLPLEGLRALVGGGSRGIGLGCAEAFAAAGAVVTLMARDRRALDEAASALPRPLDQSHGVFRADSSDWEEMGRVVRDSIEAEGPVQILVNNTGGPSPGPAADAAHAEFDDAFAMHIHSGQVLVQAVVPGMKDAGYGRILNIVSSSVVTPLPNLGVSNTIRGAVAQWGRTLASELAAFGITVNNILPGSIDTSRLRTTRRRTSDRTGEPVDAIESRTISAIPAGRLGVPLDVGEVAAFLASPAAGYVNGVNLPVDGGKTAVQ